MNIIKSFRNLTRFELSLWIVSVVAVVGSYLFSGAGNALSAIASFIGVTALIFMAKGDVVGQLLTVVFAVFYGVISITFKYYGEMITYVGMTAPIAAMAVVSWLRHPYEGNKSEVEVNRLKSGEIMFMFALATAVTAAFYFILEALDTANLIVSTISVTTSFLASYLTFRRSAFYALAYAANDIILIILWIMATIDDIKYLPMIICFVMFFINDMYGFINWSRMKKRQSSKKTIE